MLYAQVRVAELWWGFRGWVWLVACWGEAHQAMVHGARGRGGSVWRKQGVWEGRAEKQQRVWAGVLRRAGPNPLEPAHFPPPPTPRPAHDRSSCSPSWAWRKSGAVACRR
jgi:hypothetical protein